MRNDLRDVVMLMVEKYGDDVATQIGLRDWDVEIKEEALAMLEVQAPEDYMVEMGELHPSELE